MKQMVRYVAAVALLVSVAGSDAGAQSSIEPYVGVGMISPSGDFGDYAETGLAVFAGFNRRMPANPRMTWGLTVFYGQADHEGSFGESTSLPGLFGEVGYALSTGSVVPYVRGSLGFLQHRYDAGDTGFEDESETNLAYGVGAGLAKAFGSRSLFGGVHFTGGDTQFLTFYAGFGFGGASAPAGARRF